MGTFYVSCSVKGHAPGCKAVPVQKLLVDTGSDYTWILQSRLSKAGVKPVKKDVQFQMANGQTITRTVGFAIVRVLDDPKLASERREKGMGQAARFSWSRTAVMTLQAYERVCG